MSVKNLSSEELAKILKEVREEDKESSSLSLHSTVIKFISDYAIENGNQLVPNYAVYYIYRYVYKPWNYLDYWSFSAQFKSVFPMVRHAKTRYFKLGEEFPYKPKKDDLYKSTIKGLIHGRIQKNKQKKQSKVSSPKEGL